MSIKIIQHRVEKSEDISVTQVHNKNSGIEMDVRDYQGDLVICHDIPVSNQLLFEDFVKDFKEKFSDNLTLAINIKSAGIQKKLKVILNKYDLKDYFTFDMAVPDSLGYINQKLNPYIRHSDYEKNPIENNPYLYNNSVGIWLDQFEESGTHQGLWFNANTILTHLKNKKKVCIVSPELHAWGRIDENTYKAKWAEYKNLFANIPTESHENIAICTKHPIEALKFFNR